MALRNVSNFTDLNNALRELYSFKDQYTTQNLDFHGRMIKNASPAVDPNDYVILAQLPTFTQEQQPFSQSKAGAATQKYDKITFGIANGAPAQVGTNFTPPFIWSLPNVGTPVFCFYAWNVSPTGASLIIDIKKGGSSLFQTPITIAAGSTPLTVQSKSDFANGLSFSQKDLVIPQINQVGATIPGQGIEVVIVCTLS